MTQATRSMQRHFPVFATILVLIAVATMVALGIWQLQRKTEKEALIALFAANQSKSEIVFPAHGPVAPNAMFRKSSAYCLKVAEWRSGAGKDNTGKSGIRYIAECVGLGGEGPGFVVAVGVADRANLTPQWAGGAVAGIVTTEPDRQSLIGRLLGQKTVLRPMIVARQAPAGMRAAAPPSPKDVPNNHLAYAVQWFLFAASACVIYLLAVRKRMTAS